MARAVQKVAQRCEQANEHGGELGKSFNSNISSTAVQALGS